MNEKQRRFVRDSIRRGCGQCGKPGVAVFIWSFFDTIDNKAKRPILSFISCEDHLEEARVDSNVIFHLRTLQRSEESVKSFTSSQANSGGATVIHHGNFAEAVAVITELEIHEAEK